MRQLGNSLLFFAPLVILGAASAQNSNTSQTRPVISLNIIAVQESVKTGSPVRLKVTLKNESNHDVLVGREIRGLDCKVDVLYGDGKRPPDTKLGRVWNGNAPIADTSDLSPQDLRGKAIYGTLKAGEVTVWELDVSKRYEIVQPGKYTVQIERGDPENPSLVVKSNTITLTVTP